MAGQDEAKEALIELVDFLHQPENKIRSIGARLAQGRAAGGPSGHRQDADRPGRGRGGGGALLLRIRLRLCGDVRGRRRGPGAGTSFKQANEKAPCIVFIDEIDAIGKKRDTSGINVNDERERALNQLLAEMDGFDPNKGIVVLGATNRPEILDKALLRPGRFDRRIAVDLPDLKGREAVLKVHARPIHMGKDVDYTAIAKATVGASGADLANIINEAALRAVRMGHPAVLQQDLEAAVDTVIAGSERKSRWCCPRRSG